MTIYDVSIPLSPETPAWPGEQAFVRTEIKKGAQKDITLSEIKASLHSGTHMDAPRHFIPNGRAIDEFPPKRFMGRARVVHVPGRSPIDASCLDPEKFKGVTRVLFKTGNSASWEKSGFDPDFTGLDISAARLLVASGVMLVGIDYLSIEPYESPENPVHRFLMSHDVLILEGLNLSRVPEGEYELICLPLKVAGAEASPVRAVLDDRPRRPALAADG